MKRKLFRESGFLNSRALILFLLCGAACSIVTGTLFAFFRAQTPSKVSQRTLTFAERVAYQRAIEDIYWRHRIWPNERPDHPKPALNGVMSQAQLEKKVADYLRKSQVLEDYWQRPITAAQLQAELDRMAQNTKQPEMLKELFDALGNDPFVIAECLARPALADRLLTSWYAHDERIHGALKQRIEAKLQAHPTVEQLKQLSGKYSEIELAKSDSTHDADDRRAPDSVKLDSREWDETVQKLAAVFGKSHLVASAPNAFASAQPIRLPAEKPDLADLASPVREASIAEIKTGVVSPLQEDEGRYYATAVLSKTTDRLRLVTASWPKEPLESWIATAENQSRDTVAATSLNYRLPAIPEGTGCIDDTWAATMGPPDVRESHTAVWTGSEMIVWGGIPGDVDARVLNTGGKYNPATDTWTATSTAAAPEARLNHTAVWTGSEMIVWGGADSPVLQYANFFNTGGRYNPITDSWTATSTTNAPAARELHTAVWTGSEMIVWSGVDCSGIPLFTGGRYNPSTDSWTATSNFSAPLARFAHTAVWTGSEMIIWGGSAYCSVFGDGKRYDPGTDSWTDTSVTNAPDARYFHTAVWTGNEMIIWGGQTCTAEFSTGGRYSPTTDSWTATSTTNAPAARELHTAVWTGSEMIVWGGSFLNTGGSYDPTTDSWTNTGSNNAPSGRSGHTAVWTGSEMIVWGGDFIRHNIDYFNTGGRYDPATDSWIATSTTNVPSARYGHTAVWNGTEMIVWGGYGGGSNEVNTGGRYDPTLDAWTATSTTNAALARIHHTAVWTGTEMIVWGGYGCGGNCRLNTGGRYDPGTDSWTVTTTANAPEARWDHIAVWTGSEMVVWGGTNETIDLNTGGRYNPTDDTWTATTLVNAPLGRIEHTAVWTGNEMIVWGGSAGDGGRYNPTNDSWTNTGLGGEPANRALHTAVWTGSEMIVWGGSNSILGFLNTGGRYNPQTDSWTATSISNAPIGRESHTAVWSGSEMIVWGGDDIQGYLNSGGRYCAQGGPSPTPTPTPTSTPTATVTPTATPIATATATPTATPTPRATATPRITPSPRNRPTPPPRP